MNFSIDCSLLHILAQTFHMKQLPGVNNILSPTVGTKYLTTSQHWGMMACGKPNLLTEYGTQFLKQ